jgi:hypothetical protein
MSARKDCSKPLGITLPGGHSLFTPMEMSHQIGRSERNSGRSLFGRFAAGLAASNYIVGGGRDA